MMSNISKIMKRSFKYTSLVSDLNLITLLLSQGTQTNLYLSLVVPLVFP